MQTATFGESAIVTPFFSSMLSTQYTSQQSALFTQPLLPSGTHGSQVELLPLVAQNPLQQVPDWQFSPISTQVGVGGWQAPLTQE